MEKNVLRIWYKNKCIQISFAILTLIFFGCSTPSGLKLNPSEIRDMNSEIKSPQQYILGYGDIISIKFLYNPELNNDAVTIGLDGKISMHLIGEIHAQGLTLPKLNTLLTKKYYKKLGYSLDTYTLGIGDTLSTKLLYNSELNSEVKVRPDGKISLPLINEIMVAGKTPSQLETLVTHRYAEKLESEDIPEITIIVQDFKIPQLNVSLVKSASQIVYIVGEINQPKVMNMTGPMKVLQAIALSGGVNNNARLDSIVLIRHSKTDDATAYLLDMNQVLAGEIPDVDLRPYDIVFVPKTSMAKTDIFMQSIWHMIPPNILFSFPYNLNPDSKVQVTNN